MYKTCTVEHLCITLIYTETEHMYGTMYCTLQTLRKEDGRRLEASETLMWKRMEMIKWVDTKNEEVLWRVGKKRQLL